MKQKHLTIDDREKIEEMLKEGLSFTDIGNEINKHRTTISKEILNHRFKKEHIQYCSSFANCIDVEICENAGSKYCNKSCKDFKEKECIISKRPPYVCNGCKK